MASKKKAGRMGRPRKPLDLKRTARVVAMLTEDEYAALQEEAVEAGEREFHLWVRLKLTTPLGSRK
jgi:hypothetical protein